MKAVVKMFDPSGDKVLMEWDTETANMDEVNAYIDKVEKETGGRAFDLDSGNAVDNATRENTDIAVVRPIAGG